MALDPLYAQYSGQNSGQGPAGGGFFPSAADKHYAALNRASSMEAQRYALLTDPRAYAMTSFALTRMYGREEGMRRLGMDDGRAFNHMTSLMLNNPAFNFWGGRNTDLAFGLEQLAGGSGLRMLRDGQSNQFFGSGLLTSQLASQLTTRVNDHFFDAAGLPDYSRTHGLDRTDLGVMYDQLRLRGNFAGMQAFEAKYMTADDIQSKMTEARGAKDTRMVKALEALQTDPSGGAYSFEVDSNMEQRLLKMAETTSGLVSTMKNFIQSNDVRELMREAENITGMTAGTDSQAMQGRIQSLVTMANAAGVSPTQVLQQASVLNQNGVALFGSMEAAAQATPFVMRAGLGSYQQALERNLLLRSRGLNVSDPSLNEMLAMQQAGMARIGQESGLRAGYLALSNFGTMSSENRDLIRGALGEYQSAKSEDERAAAQGKLDNVFRATMGMSTAEFMARNKNMQFGNAAEEENFHRGTSDIMFTRRDHRIREVLRNVNAAGRMGLDEEMLASTMSELQIGLGVQTSAEVVEALSKGDSGRVNEILTANKEYLTQDPATLAANLASISERTKAKGTNFGALYDEMQLAFNGDTFLSSNQESRKSRAQMTNTEIHEIISRNDIGGERIGGNLLEQAAMGFLGQGMTGNDARLRHFIRDQYADQTTSLSSKDGKLTGNAEELVKIMRTYNPEQMDKLLDSKFGGSAGLAKKMESKAGFAEVVKFAEEQGMLFESGIDADGTMRIQAFSNDAKKSAQDAFKQMGREKTVAVLTGAEAPTSQRLQELATDAMVSGLNPLGIGARQLSRAENLKRAQDVNSVEFIEAFSSNFDSLVKGASKGEGTDQYKALKAGWQINSQAMQAVFDKREAELSGKTGEKEQAMLEELRALRDSLTGNKENKYMGVMEIRDRKQLIGNAKVYRQS